MLQVGKKAGLVMPRPDDALEDVLRQQMELPVPSFLDACNDPEFRKQVGHLIARAQAAGPANALAVSVQQGPVWS